MPRPAASSAAELTLLPVESLSIACVIMLEEFPRLRKASWDIKSLLIEVIILSPFLRAPTLKFCYGLAGSGLHRLGLFYWQIIYLPSVTQIIPMAALLSLK
jgi:hypothetical protein